MPAVDYTAQELIYAPRNPRIHKAYGFSPVEQVQISVNIALRRQIYQLQYYTEGNVPEALIGVPENWNPDQIRQFQSYWDALNAGDTAERRHAKFVPGGVAKTFVPVREPALKDAFDEWLARVVCYAFSLPPTAFTAQVNRATAENAQDVALAEGLAPLQNWVKHLIDRVLADEFGAADLEFAWDQDRDADPAETATIATDYVKAGIKSINEVRAELGLPPVAGGEQPKIQTAQGLVPLTQSAAPPPSPPPAAKAETLRRYNDNHYGPGERGGQFAPAGEGGGSSLDGRYETEAHLVPVQFRPPSVLDAVRGLKPEPPPAEPPPASLPVPAEQAAPETNVPAKEPETPSIPEEPSSEDEKPPDFEVPKEQPSGDDAETPYGWTKKIVGALKNAMNSGNFKAAESIAIAVDSAKWLRDQAANIISSFDPPKDLSDLQAAAQKDDSDPGYEDHHIVEKGKQNDDLSPSDKARIDADDNIVRIPYSAHRCITAYYQTKQPQRDDMTPREFLRGQSFEDRYNYGLDVMKICGALRK